MGMHPPKGLHHYLISFQQLLGQGCKAKDAFTPTLSTRERMHEFVLEGRIGRNKGDSLC